jgi:hypothetical protein
LIDVTAFSAPSKIGRAASRSFLQSAFISETIALFYSASAASLEQTASVSLAT